MLNINNEARKFAQDFALYDSGKSCYVLARFGLEVTVFDFVVPSFLLMQQSLENLIKACLKAKKINWEFGNKGHEFRRLIDLGENIDFFKEKITNRPDFLSLLKELESGYNAQRYGESGHFLENHEKMMDLFDEMIYILVVGFTTLIEPRRNNDELERFMALPVPSCVEKVLRRKLKKPFIFIEPYPDNSIEM